MTCDALTLISGYLPWKNTCSSNLSPPLCRQAVAANFSGHQGDLMLSSLSQFESLNLNLNLNMTKIKVGKIGMVSIYGFIMHQDCSACFQDILNVIHGKFACLLVKLVGMADVGCSITAQ